MGKDAPILQVMRVGELEWPEMIDRAEGSNKKDKKD